MKTKKKTILGFIAVLAIAIFTGSLLVFLSETRANAGEPAEEPALLVDTMQLNHDAMAIESEFAGTVVSENTVNTVATVTGMVEEIYVQPGTYVEEGTELFRINDEAAQLGADLAQATYNQAAMAAQVSTTNAERGVITAEASQNTLVTQRDAANAELSAVADAAQAAVNHVNAAKPADVPLPLEADFDLDGTPGLSAEEQALFQAKVAEVNGANQTAQAEWQAQLTQAQNALDTAVQARDQSNASFNTQIGYASQTVANAHNSVAAATNSGNAAMSSAGVGISTAELQMEQYTVTAPVSGTVDFMNVNVGGMISPSSIACSISDHENLQVQFDVSESVKEELALGQTVHIDANGTSFSGTIAEIAPVANTQTQLYTIVADIGATAEQLPLNTTVKVLAERGNVQDSIIIPYSALQFSADKTYVYTVQDGMAVQTAVTLGAYNHENVEVLEGLSENDVLITNWSASLRHGTVVTNANIPVEQALEESVDENH